MHMLAYEVGVSGSSEKAPAASDRALPVERLEKLHCPQGGYLVVTLAVQRGRHKPRLSRVHFHACALLTTQPSRLSQCCLFGMVVQYNMRCHIQAYCKMRSVRRQAPTYVSNAEHNYYI